MWFTQIGNGIEEFSLIVKGLHKYICSSSPLVDVAASLEVLFLHPGVVSLTGGDAQVSSLVKRDTNHVVGVPQVAELGDLLKEEHMLPNNFEWSRSKRSFYGPLAHLTLHPGADGDTATLAHLSLCSGHTARHLRVTP
ncbi:unnamed protein product [Malus baccata var. baccata]